MKRPRLRVLVGLIGAITFSLVGTTSYALYRTAMGPEQCCKSHCRRNVPKKAAERCCRTHLTVTPAAISKELSAKDASAPAHVTCSVPPGVTVGVLVSPSRPPVVDGRAPPGRTLVAQHALLLI